VVSLLISGLLAVIVSLLGCAVVKVEASILPRIYGSLLLISFGILYRSSTQFKELTRTNSKGLQTLCTNDPDASPLLLRTFRPYQ
jgi:CBS-domain-containing membrane protein